ncbi:MAG TPA: SpoIIE family protein phosphatase [Terrimicrobiaceae bacterium]
MRKLDPLGWCVRRELYIEPEVRRPGTVTISSQRRIDWIEDRDWINSGASRPVSPDLQQIDLKALIGHTTSVQAEARLEDVYQLFEKHKIAFIAVLENERVIGMCSRWQIGMLLGSRYGFSLFSRKSVRDRLLADALVVSVHSPLVSVLEQVDSRSEEAFYDDVVLVNERGSFLGLIFTRTLVQIQYRFLRQNIERLEETQREINAKNDQMHEELRMAKEVQLAMLPRRYPSFPADVPNEASVLRFSHCYHPAGEVSGDFFSVVRLSNETAGVFICDVMGHGVRSALVTAMLRAMVEELSSEAGDPGRLLSRMNRGLRVILRESDHLMFATAYYLLINTAKRCVRYAAAGHPLPLHLRRAPGLVEQLGARDNSRGPALGLFEEPVYLSGQRDLDGGDVLLLFTDGLFEAVNEADMEFGEARLATALVERRDQPVQRLLDGVMSDVERFMGTRKFGDDVCAVAMELTP